MPSHEESQAATTTPSARAERRWFIASAAALGLAAFAATFTQVFNYDIFWHLASGEWMLAHGAVLGTDPFSVQPLPEWVNVHWLFQLIVAWLYGIGGFGALSGLKATLATATMVVFAFALRRRVPVAWLVVCGLMMIVVIETRVRVRPEAFTMLLLMSTIALVEHVRRGGSPNRLWLLVPMMAVWVNMHGLYVLGPAIFWSAALGAVLDRRLGRAGMVCSVPVRATEGERLTASLRTGEERLTASLRTGLASWQALAPLAAATAACFVSPWPLEAAAQPLLLWTRISGQTAAFTKGVSEFQPTWESVFFGTLTAVMVVPTVVACLLRWRKVPLAHAAWLVAFAGLAMLACRNVALTGPVCGYLLALHGGELWRAWGRRGDWLRAGAPSAGSVPVPGCPGGREKGTGTRRGGSQSPAAHRLVLALRIASLVLAMAFAAGSATEWIFQFRGVHQRFGPGLFALHYATEVAQHLAAVPGGGDIFCENWGDAGPFIYYCQPRRVWMDGRLEAHTLDRFLSQGRISEALRSPQSAATVELPRELRFFFVRSLSRDHLTGLALSGRFRLRFVDPTGAVFERADWPGAAAHSDPGEHETNLAAYDRPLGPDMRIEGRPVQPRRWWRRNELSPNYRLGAMFLWLGWQPTQTLNREDSTRSHMNLLAVRYLEAALADGLTDPPTTTGMLAFAHQQRAMYEDVTPSEEVPFDLHSSRALYLYGLMNLKDLADENTRQFAEQHVDALVRARLIDLADQAAAELLRDLPAKADPALGRQYTELAKKIAARLADSRRRAAGLAHWPLNRADVLARPDIGLMNDALAEAGKSKVPAIRCLLRGDLLLRCGQTGLAKWFYGELLVGGKIPTTPGPLPSMDNLFPHAPWKLNELVYRRLAVVLAVTGQYLPADWGLGELRKISQVPQAAYYHALILETLGRYEQAREVLKGVEPKEEQLSRLIDALRARLPG